MTTKKLFKKLISILYHKYVCKPVIDNSMFLEEYLEVCEEAYKVRKYYNIETYEQLSAINDIALVNWRMKKLAQDIKNESNKTPMFMGSKEHSEQFYSNFEECVPDGRK